MKSKKPVKSMFVLHVGFWSHKHYGKRYKKNADNAYNGVVFGRKNFMFHTPGELLDILESEYKRTQK